MPIVGSVECHLPHSIWKQCVALCFLDVYTRQILTRHPFGQYMFKFMECRKHKLCLGWRSLPWSLVYQNNGMLSVFVRIQMLLFFRQNVVFAAFEHDASLSAQGKAPFFIDNFNVFWNSLSLIWGVITFLSVWRYNIFEQLLSVQRDKNRDDHIFQNAVSLLLPVDHPEQGFSSQPKEPVNPCLVL